MWIARSVRLRSVSVTDDVREGAVNETGLGTEMRPVPSPDVAPRWNPIPADTLRQTRAPTEKSNIEPESCVASTVLVPLSRYCVNVTESLSDPSFDSNATLKLA